MKITVEHDVPYDRNLETTCQYSGDFWGNPVCKYHTHRDRTHGKKAPMERHVPKCALFDVWLPGDYQKCDECLAAIKEKQEKINRLQSLIDHYRQENTLSSNFTADVLEEMIKED